MRRPALVYLLIAAVLLAAGGLAYYGYSYSAELSDRERYAILDTMRELAEEKVIGIESEILKSERPLFTGVDIGNLLELREVLATERPAIETVLILDENLDIVPGGFFTKRTRKEDIDRFRKLFAERVLPDLRLPEARLGIRGSLHTNYHGRPYVFSYMRRYGDGRTFYVVLEEDLSYMVGTIFPQFFGVASPRLYQVVNRSGEVIYGFPFTGIPEADVVEMPFTETVDNWRLRVAQKDAGARSSRHPRQLVDLVLIGSAMAIIVVGLGILVVAMRRERRANELKSEFISNVSHELKTPLSIISMFGEMLAMGRTRSSDQAHEYAEIIWRESVRLSRLIDNVLDFAKIERGADAYEFAEDDVGEVVERAVELSRHRFDRAEMVLEVTVEPDLPVLSIDSNALTLAVLNLLDNALKYAAEGGRLEVAVGREKGRVVLQVRDFGPGIPEDDQPHVFERFYRARSVRLQPIRGSGIGLALVKHIAQAHHGDIEVDSREGQGATFRLWIPVPESARF
jgi:two-component system, OmpR family, phosphate regulon sensor histidine kinase PhoR